MISQLHISSYTGKVYALLLCSYREVRHGRGYQLDSALHAFT